jgi:hypothetical protein
MKLIFWIKLDNSIRFDDYGWFLFQEIDDINTIWIRENRFQSI